MMKTLSLILILSLLSNGNLLEPVEVRSLDAMNAATIDDFLPIPFIGTTKPSTLNVIEGHNFNDANTLANVKAFGPALAAVAIMDVVNSSFLILRQWSLKPSE
ncbi:uncharacterized protein LOC111499519 [Cucurbita maxima]|uniref:Uncharacterized protein LOC111499519 n=1 Tax=Cucurbita maxima TaxID=3661 RepID=A0A6J1L1A9_CUCMA|nr:uncharacterized protein LOC111499519 [Cucurbita maxima]